MKFINNLKNRKRQESPLLAEFYNVFKGQNKNEDDENDFDLEFFLDEITSKLTTRFLKLR